MKENAVVIWRDMNTGVLRYAETFVGYCYSPPKPGQSYELGLVRGVDKVTEPEFDVENGIRVRIDADGVRIDSADQGERGADGL